MKINDYSLCARYQNEEFCKSDIWPNRIAQHRNIELYYRGLIIARIFGKNPNYSTPIPSRIVMSYSFPTASAQMESTENISFTMISKDADLRPLIFKVLRDECKLLVKLPYTPYQYHFCKSLLSYLGDNI